MRYRYVTQWSDESDPRSSKDWADDQDHDTWGYALEALDELRYQQHRRILRRDTETGRACVLLRY